MKVLLREIQKGADGSEERRDQVFEGERLTIGGAPGQDIQLLGTPAHYASIEPTGATLRLRAAPGTNASSRTLQAGDELVVEGHQLRVIAAPAGFDAAIEIRRNLDLPPAAFEKAFTTDLVQTRMSKRVIAWVLAALVLATGLVMPLAFRSSPPPIAADAGVTPTTDAATTKGSSFFFSDAFWNSGPLSAAHHSATGDNCSACHTALFGRVPDAACARCHQGMADHVPAARRTELGLPAPHRCATCHHEHDEPASHLLPTRDEPCAACHGSNGAAMQKAGLKPATDFSPGAHPKFSARLPRPPDDAHPDWSFVRVALGDAKQTSNLKFSHQQHLAGGSVVRPADGGALNCADCHKPSADGEHFEPLTMAQVCSGCHSLGFDPDQPDRQLPHGKGHLREVILTLQDHFVRKAVDPAARSAPRMRRRLPGEAPQVEIDPVCNAATVACGTARAEQAIRVHFGEKGCGSCHVVIENGGAASVVDRYTIAPVRLVYDYQPNAVFNHRQHRQMGDAGGDAACLGCHEVTTSEDSSELHLPDIERCADCHGGRNAIGRIRSTCMGCHSYHPEAQ